MNNHTTLATHLLNSSRYALEMIKQHHQLTHAESEIIERAYMSCASMLKLQNKPERGMTVRVDVETVVQTGAGLKADRTALALEYAYDALTMQFCTPLHETDGLAELAEDAVQALLTGSVL